MILLELNDLNLVIDNSRLIRDLNFKILDDQIAGIIGTAEAGKTILFDIISGFYKPTSGKIIFRGQNISGMHVDKINKLGIARVFQDDNIFLGLTVEDNIKMGFYNKISYGLIDTIMRKKDFIEQESLLEKKVDELLDIFNIQEYKKSLGYDISKDTRCKLNIARALASAPRLLLLDRPTNGMNKEQAQNFMLTIEMLNRKYKTAIIIVEEEIDLIANVCTQMSVMEYGTIIATDTPEVIRSNSILRSIYLGEKLGGKS